MDHNGGKESSFGVVEREKYRNGISTGKIGKVIFLLWNLFLSLSIVLIEAFSSNGVYNHTISSRMYIYNIYTYIYIGRFIYARVIFIEKEK